MADEMNKFVAQVADELECDEEPFDPTALDQFRELDEGGADEFIEELINTYLQDAPELLRELQEAMARSDLAAVKRKAHTLKGSSMNLGAKEMSWLCARLEEQALMGATEQASLMVSRIENAFERAREEFDKLLSSKV